MKGTVFLLEDDKSICELVRCALEMADIDTVCFNTVADFNAALNQHLPAVALLDIMLPDGSGLDDAQKAQTRAILRSPASCSARWGRSPTR